MIVRAEPAGGVGRVPGRLAPLVAPSALAALAVAAAALWQLAGSGVSGAAAAGLVALLAASALAEAFPVPVDGVSAEGVSLAVVFLAGAAVVYGWAPAALLGALTCIPIELATRRSVVRLVYNSSVYALAAAAAGAAASWVETETAAGVLAAVLLASGAFYVVDVVLVAAVVALVERERFRVVLPRSVFGTALTFAIMASVTLMLAIVWERSPFLAAALAGPLVAVALYQRSVQRALSAMRLALTDPLTGLGNQRHFGESLERCLAAAGGSPVTLCLVDIDDLKQLNDRQGHPVADRVLVQVATHLRGCGEAFRLGGDEFALVLPGRDEAEAMLVASRVVARIAAGSYEHGCQVSVSAGIATFPRHGSEAAELLKVADSALYWAKAQGKDRACSYTEELVELARRSQTNGGGGNAVLRAAAGVARAVDLRAAYGPSRCEAVADLAGRLALRLGLDQAEAELVRLAGRLHDLGKLAVPEEILRKPDVLTEPERRLIERHAQIGFRTLDALGLRSVSRWILHHHERWDGEGYPDRLAGEGIPLAARILFVADAFDAMTAERVYRRQPLSEDEALAELERCAGSQFDPDVVAALAKELEEARAADARVAA